MQKYGRLALVSAVAFLLGGTSYWIASKLMHAEPASVRHDESTVYTADFQPHPVAVACPKNARRVILIAGQSNAANYEDAPHRDAKASAFNFYDGQCYLAKDPLLGASGDRSSVWITVANNMTGPIILAPVAIGGSWMMEWRPGGRLFPRIETATMQLHQRGLTISDVVFVQGESEGSAGADAGRYFEDAKVLYSKLANIDNAKVYVALASRCLGEPNEAIRSAQSKAIAAAHVRAGPDLDKIDNRFRVNGCHFNAEGADQIARQWASTLNRPSRLSFEADTIQGKP